MFFRQGCSSLKPSTSRIFLLENSASYSPDLAPERNVRVEALQKLLRRQVGGGIVVRRR